MIQPPGTAKIGLMQKGTAGELTQEQLDYIVSQVPPTDISGKVDKVTGKSLVTDTAITDLTDGGETNLHTHAGSGLTIETVKADTDIASAISLKHSNSTDHAVGSDNQDLSNLVVKVTGSSLVPDSAISNIHAPGSDNQIIPSALADLTDDSTHRIVTDTEKSTWNAKGSSNLILGDLAADAYYGDKGKTAYDHSQAAHAPSGATIGADWNTNLSNIPSTFAPATHNQGADTITTGTLDGDRLPTISTTKKGSVPLTGTPSGKFLKDDNTWAAPTASVAITEVEIDCGVTPLLETIINVVNTGITVASKIIGGIAYKSPTGKDLDELEMDAIDLKFEPTAGSFNIYIKGLEGYISDKFIIWYLFA
jgi:hypothetical protein